MNTENTIETKDTYLEVTWGRALAVWWAWVWRCGLILIASGLLSLGVLFLFTLLLQDESIELLMPRMGSFAVAITLVFSFVLVKKWLVTYKKFKGFYIALLGSDNTLVSITTAHVFNLFFDWVWKAFCIFFIVELIMVGAFMCVGFLFGLPSPEGKEIEIVLAITVFSVVSVLLASFYAQIYAMKLVLNKQFKKYRVVLVPNN